MQPKWPTLAAIGFFILFVALLGYPLLSGQWLVGPNGDQIGGFAVRDWAARHWHAEGHVPLWNPMIFGGLPYVATLGFGDVFYPFSFLRLFVSADVALGMWMVGHTILAGLFTYLLLRRLGISWMGSVVGGLAYQLSGIIISQPNPGHDGKLAASTMLPLAFLALYAAVRERRWWGYGLLSVAVALSMLSPHVQMTYYLLIASGLFALYCAFGEPGEEKAGPRIVRLAVALAAVLVGFGVAAPQLLPFFQYIPFSPRAESFGNFERSASYAIPWNHVPELIIGGFTGEGFRGDTYWGSNALKLHSEYLGLPVIALAILGFTDRRRRLVWWLTGIGALFMLISLGASTPFYRIWWSVMPFVKQTRAPGMAFFVPTMIAALFAGFGINRLERNEGSGHVRVWLVAAAVAALLGLSGVLGSIAAAMAGELAMVAVARDGAIRSAAVLGALALAGIGALAALRGRERIPAVVFALGVPLIVGADLFFNARPFWNFQGPARQGLYREDPLVARVKQSPLPYRVLDLSAHTGAPAYPINVLMGHDIPQVLGYFGFELQKYDELLGGQNQWRFLLSTTKLWNLLGVRFVITPDTMSLPGYHNVLGPITTAAGRTAFLYEADTIPDYVRVVPMATKVDDDRIPVTLADPRLPGFDRVVFLAQDAPVQTPQLTGWPAASASRARVTSYRSGAMTIDLDPAPTAPSYLLVAENWYVDWRASIDGQAGQVLRGNHSLITVPLPAGARRVELDYHSAKYQQGKLISFTSLAVILASIAVSVMQVRRRGA